MGPKVQEAADRDSSVAAPALRHSFYVLRETPCPYIAGRRERKLMTEIRGTDPTRFYALLSRAGFRRSHNFAYRPACTGCSACIPVRVRVGTFRPGRSLRRVARANRDLRVTEHRPQATQEQFRLFERYVVSRHGDGEMAGMSFRDYRAMTEESRLDTRLTEFREGDGRLVAACLSDWLEDGPSAVYSFFDPDLATRSLGTYMVLWLIDEARERALPHVYLGYWIAQSRKMAYKARFRPLEGLRPGGWQPLQP